MNRNNVNIIENGRDVIDLRLMGLEYDQIIILGVAGSHMYGTSTPESDRDYLGVYLPTRRQLLLNDYPKQVSLPKDSGLDLQIWSIHYFLKLACQGETMAIDLTHMPEENMIVADLDVWYEIVGNRKLFYTKQMKSFVSYARKQAAKYGIKGTRIKAIKDVIEYLDGCMSSNPFHIDGKLKDVWNNLPSGKHIHFLDTKPYRMYQICGKKFLETVKISYIKEHLEKDLTEYGKRAKLAEENKGIDWKAISHALRSSYQVRDILTKGDYSYPLKNADFVTNVKLGKYNFKNIIQPILDDLMNNIERMMEISNLPDEVDKDFWENWLLNLIQEHVL